MKNFYTSKEHFTDKTVRLFGDEHHHATRSCRVKVGELIGVTDGCGKRVHALIEKIDNKSLTASIERDVSGTGEIEAEIILALSIIRPVRFETAVEKCTELGIRQIIPLIAKRCDPNSSKRLKIDRLRKIAYETAKQSGRSWIPEISSPIKLMDFLKRQDGSVIAASQHADKSIEQVDLQFFKKKLFEKNLKINVCGRLTDCSKLSLVIGPEGDFTDEEYTAMTEFGVEFFSMGELTLRSETAGIAATALVVNLLRTNAKKI